MEKIRVLIVEDEAVVALDIKKKLIKLGYTAADIVTTGEDAVEKVNVSPPDLILMDISLEGEMDGIEAAERIRGGFDIPIIYLTAHADKKTLDRARVTEPFGYIVKPFEKETLHATIEMALYKRRMMKKVKEAEEEKKRLMAYLEKAHRLESLGTLAGGIAHNFNNILSIILGFTELAMSDLPEDSPVYSNLENVLQGCFRARDAVKQIMLFSNPVSGKMGLVRIGLIVEESLKFLRSYMPENIEIRQNIAREPGAIMGDAAQIHQVFINLCTNAVNAMKEKGGLLEVTLEPVELEKTTAGYLHDLKPGNYTRLTVADTGCGMTPGTMERVFEPYFTTMGIGEGSGMGLAVVHGIVKNHGGAVTVQSEPGKGSTFQVYLPLSEAEVESETHMKPSGLTPRGHERILFVDDEEGVVDMVKKMLEYLGYQVETKINSQEALETFKSQPDQFDLVITDMIMPNISGIKLTREIREINPAVSIIICTGFRENIAKEEIESLGIGAVMVKPIVMQEMAQIIRDVLDNVDNV
jgi:signal transduction histidine kinase